MTANPPQMSDTPMHARRFRLSAPTQAQRNAALSEAAQEQLPYAAVGLTRTQGCPPGYRRTQGRGQLHTQDFAAAKRLLRHWRGFPHWVQVQAQGALHSEQNVVVIGHIYGLWVTNMCRVTYVIDEPDAYGFGYGALSAHVEKGEERFLLRRTPTGQVEYEIYSFSRANHWTTRLVPPITQHLQRRFIADAISNLRRQLSPAK